MRVINLRRGEGKTTEIIKAADKKNGTIVCHTETDVRSIKKRAREMGCEINNPVSYFDLIEGRLNGKGIRDIHIDNIDDILYYHLHEYRIKTVSIGIDDPDKRL